MKSDKYLLEVSPSHHISMISGIRRKREIRSILYHTTTVSEAWVITLWNVPAAIHYSSNRFKFLFLARRFLENP